MKWMIGCPLALGLLAGCAQKPEEISAAYVSPTQYQSYSCYQIADEARRVSARLSAVSTRQEKQANDDAAATAVGMILFWPALFFIDGDDENAAELSRLKGEMEALEAANTRQGCGITFRSA